MNPNAFSLSSNTRQFTQAMASPENGVDPLIEKYLNFQKPEGEAKNQNQSPKVATVTYSVKGRHNDSRVDKDYSDTSFDFTGRPGIHRNEYKMSYQPLVGEGRPKTNIKYSYSNVNKEENESYSIYSDTGKTKNQTVRYLDSSILATKGRETNGSRADNENKSAQLESIVINKEFKNLYNARVTETTQEPKRNQIYNTSTLNDYKSRLESYRAKYSAISSNTNSQIDLKSYTDDQSVQNERKEYRRMDSDDQPFKTQEDNQPATFSKTDDNDSITRQKMITSPLGFVKNSKKPFVDVSPLMIREERVTIAPKYDDGYYVEDEPVLDMLNTELRPAMKIHKLRETAEFSVPHRMRNDVVEDKEEVYFEEVDQIRNNIHADSFGNILPANLGFKVREIERVNIITNNKTEKLEWNCGTQTYEKSSENRGITSDTQTTPICTANNSTQVKEDYRDSLTSHQVDLTAFTHKFLLAVETERLIFMTLQMYSRFTA